MKALVIACSLVLAGCACKPKIEYVSVPVEVKVLVPVKCKMTLPKKPESVIDGVSPTETFYQKAMALMKDAEEQRQYVKELEVAAAACIEEK